MQKIAPCLWFDDKAEEAVKFYVSIFKDSKIGDITPNNYEKNNCSLANVGGWFHRGTQWRTRLDE
jgi:predicted 3-demethylubiquinone-9 3-methyltransferase (glyoxalase superfamily)